MYSKMGTELRQSNRNLGITFLRSHISWVLTCKNLMTLPTHFRRFVHVAYLFVFIELYTEISTT